MTAGGRDVIVAPMARTVGPDGPIYAYRAGGAIVHTSKPLTPADLETMAAIAKAGRRALLEMIGQQIDLERED